MRVPATSVTSRVRRSGAGLRLASACLVALGLQNAGCGQPQQDAGAPIEITTVPPAGLGGSDRRTVIGGRVSRVRDGERVVLFARTDTGVWWVQPLAAEPFTSIAPDATWKSTIHLGTEYAALLARADYQPPAKTEVLPDVGGEVIAVATVRGTGVVVTPPRQLLTFSGYEWEVRQTPSDRGGPNEYAAANAWTDAQGFLHLKLRKQADHWTSAEVILTRSLGYGTYTFVVRDTSHLDPAAALGMFTWDDLGADQNHRELDIEISQWGDRRVTNAQYVVQPFYVPANVVRFAAPAGRMAHSFRWEPGRVLFTTVRAPGARERVLEQHEFTSGIPVPGGETVRMNLYYFRYALIPLQNEVEVVFEKFQYLP